MDALLLLSQQRSGRRTKPDKEREAQEAERIKYTSIAGRSSDNIWRRISGRD